MNSFAAAQENRFGFEPDWLPTPDDVTRARQRLERQGVTASLKRSRGPIRGWGAMPAGEVPWAWWTAAAAWVALWPALLAFRYGLNRLGWLPWWLLPLLAGVHMLALAAPVGLATLGTLRASRDPIRRRFGQVRTMAELLALEPDEFEAWTMLLFQVMGYETRDTPETGDHGIDLEVKDAQISRGLVQCKRYRGTVGEPVVRDLYGTLTAAGADHAWLVTTGGFSRQAREWAAGKPIELWDGKQLLALARRYR